MRSFFMYSLTIKTNKRNHYRDNLNTRHMSASLKLSKSTFEELIESVSKLKRIQLSSDYLQ